MDKNPPSPGTSACKFLYDDVSASTCQIPSVLVKRYGDVLPPEATLKIDNSGKSWRVKIEKFRDLYFFTDGWKEFAQDVDMETREYLLFKSPGLSEFRVQSSCRNKELNSGDHQTENSKDKDCLSDEENGEVPNSLSFVVELKSYHLNRLVLPKKFINGTRVKEDKNIILQDVQGMKWLVHLTDRSLGRLAMTAGWTNFLIANNVVVGSTMSFKFISFSKNIIEARVVKEGRNKNQLFSLVKRKGGRFEVSESHRASGLTRTPEGSHKENEYGDGSENTCKGVQADDPEGSRNTGEHVEGLERSHQKVKTEDHITEEGNGSARTRIFCEELKIPQAPESSEGSEITSDRAKEPETSYKRSEHTGQCNEELNIGDQNQNSEDEDSFTDQENGSSDRRSLTFTVELRSYHMNRLDIPRKFTDGSRVKEDRKILLQDVEGRKWPVRLTDRSCGRSGMTAGWRDFLIANKVSVGSTMSFKFISCSNNIVKARVVKEGTNKKLLFNSVRREGSRFGVFETCRARGSGSSHKATEQAEEPESSHKACENAEGLDSSRVKVKSENEDHVAEEENGIGGRWIFSEEFKKEHAPGILECPHKRGRDAEVPETSGTTRERVEVSGNSLKRSKYVEESSNIHVDIKSEHGDRLSQEDNGFGMKGVFSNELKKQNAPEKPESSYNATKRAEEPETSCKTREHVELLSRSSHKRNEHAKGVENIQLNVKSEDENQCPEEENGLGVGRRWTFSKELKKCNTSKLDIPKDFSKAIGNVTNGKIKLEDCEGRKWPVHVEFRKCGAYTMTSGWIDFLVANKVRIGSSISFQLIPSSDTVIEALVIDTGNQGNELFVKRTRGRPPYVSNCQYISSRS